MRITGGEFKGRPIPSPGRDVRPTADRVREAIFSALAGRVEGASVLDLFAGSGALGLEAWSRGARAVTWIERNPRTAAAIRRSLRSLADPVPDACRVYCRDVWGALSSPPFHGVDLVFADPPYRLWERGPVGDRLLQALAEGPIVASDGRVIVEQPARIETRVLPGWTLVREKAYGDSKILMVAPKRVVDGDDEVGWVSRPDLSR